MMNRTALATRRDAERREGEEVEAGAVEAAAGARAPEKHTGLGGPRTAGREGATATWNLELGAPASVCVIGVLWTYKYKTA